MRSKLNASLCSRQGNRTPMPRLRILYPNHQMNRPKIFLPINTLCSRQGNRTPMPRLRILYPNHQMNRPWSAEAGGFEPPVREPVRQFSKLLVSATHPNFLGSLSVSEKHLLSNAGAKVRSFFQLCKFFSYFFCINANFFRYLFLLLLFSPCKELFEGVKVFFNDKTYALRVK